MQAKDAFKYLPQMMAVLIDRAGGQITFTEAEIGRMLDTDPDLQFSRRDDDFVAGPTIHVRYYQTNIIRGEAYQTTIIQGEAVDVIPGEIEAS